MFNPYDDLPEPAAKKQKTKRAAAVPVTTVSAEAKPVKTEASTKADPSSSQPPSSSASAAAAPASAPAPAPEEPPSLSVQQRLDRICARLLSDRSFAAAVREFEQWSAVLGRKQDPAAAAAEPTPSASDIIAALLPAFELLFESATPVGSGAAGAVAADTSPRRPTRLILERPPAPSPAPSAGACTSYAEGYQRLLRCLWDTQPSGTPGSPKALLQNDPSAPDGVRLTAQRVHALSSLRIFATVHPSLLQCDDNFALLRVGKEIRGMLQQGACAAPTVDAEGEAGGAEGAGALEVDASLAPRKLHVLRLRGLVLALEAAHGRMYSTLTWSQPLLEELTHLLSRQRHHFVSLVEDEKGEEGGACGSGADAGAGVRLLNRLDELVTRMATDSRRKQAGTTVATGGAGTAGSGTVVSLASRTVRAVNSSAHPLRSIQKDAGEA